MIFEIQGHSRRNGDFKKDYELGLAKAKIVEEYIAHRISGRYFTYATSLSSVLPHVGDGNRKLTEEEHLCNDRVLVRIAFKKGF